MKEIFGVLSFYWSVLAFFVSVVFAVFGWIFALCCSSAPMFYIWILNFVFFFPISLCWIIKELEKVSNKDKIK